MDFKIQPMRPEDWDAVCTIFEEGIATGNATLETSTPTWEAWNASHIPSCRLVARDEQGQILGWAALTKVSGRCVYAGVAEVSIYIAAQARGRGVGQALLNALITESEHEGFWTLQSGILAENVASVNLHLRCGFREVGVRERIGQLNGVWRSVKLLERRSSVIGL